MDQTKGSEIPWMEDAFVNSQSTSIPELEIIEQSNEIGTVVIFVISAILTITLLFGIAVFIDCRQEKLVRLSARRKPKKLLKLKLPNMGKAVREDEDTFADKMQENEPSTSNVIV